MCDGFGGFYHKDGKVYFAEPDSALNCSHGKTAARLPDWIDGQDLAAFECANWTARSFEWHNYIIPDWVDKDAKRHVLEVMKQIKPYVKEYKNATARKRARYDRVKDAAWTEYTQDRDTTLTEYIKVVVPARAEYEKITAPARTIMTEGLKQVDGFLEVRNG